MESTASNHDVQTHGTTIGPSFKGPSFKETKNELDEKS